MWKLALAFALLTITLASAQSDIPLSMPAWLTPYPGATTSNPGKASPRLIESTYTVDANTTDVLAHYRTLFASANLPFAPNFDGMGNTVRASAPECDLLLKIRDQSPGTSVKISCAAKSASPPGGAPLSTSESTGSATSTNGRLPSTRPHRSYEEAKRDIDEYNRQAAARIEESKRAGTASMGQYDQPVNPDRQKSSFYHDDAPPLVWLPWLVRMGAANACSSPSRGTEYGLPYLECRYTTSAPMSKLYQFYLDLAKANDFEIGTAHLETGHTVAGVMQNRDGHVECHHSMDGQVAGPSINAKVSFSRSNLNDPISVTMRVTVRGSFGRPRASRP